MADDKVWRVRHDLLYRRLVDGGMLYDGRHEQVHHFNATAAFVWEACQEGKIPGKWSGIWTLFIRDHQKIQ